LSHLCNPVLVKKRREEPRGYLPIELYQNHSPLKDVAEEMKEAGKATTDGGSPKLNNSD